MTHLRGDRRGLPLSDREQEALVAIVNNAPPGRHGRSRWSAAAAAALGISENTLKNHLKNANEKLGARTTEHAVALAFPLLADRYLETPERQRMGALAYEVLERRSAA